MIQWTCPVAKTYFKWKTRPIAKTKENLPANSFLYSSSSSRRIPRNCERRLNTSILELRTSPSSSRAGVWALLSGSRSLLSRKLRSVMGASEGNVSQLGNGGGTSGIGGGVSSSSSSDCCKKEMRMTNGLVQKRHNSSAKALELCLFCNNPSKSYHFNS